MRRNKGLLLLAVIALSLLIVQPGYASRDEWWDVEYDGTVYPDEASPAWTSNGAIKDSLLEGGYYLLADTATCNDFSCSFNWQNDTLHSELFTYEVRVKLDSAFGSDLHIVHSRHDGLGLNLVFKQDGSGVRLETNGYTPPWYEMQTDDALHTYRVARAADSTRLFVDGVLVLTAPNEGGDGDLFWWGTVNNVDRSWVVWDYVRIKMNAAVYPDSLSVTGDWYKSPCNPVLELDGAYPNVVDLGDSLIMYFDKYGPPQRICYATSVDGYTWVDQGTMIAPGQDGQFSWNDVSTGHVFYNQNADEYWMYYNANDGSQWHDIGLATSSNGFNWTDHGSVLTIDGSGWDSHSLGHPKVLWVEGDSQYYMLYRGAWGSASGEGAIGFASSADGLTWVREGTGPVVTPTEPYDTTAIIYPGALFSEGGEFHFYYSGVGNDGRCRVIEATSVDLINWTKQGAILEASEDWEDTHIWYATRFILNGVPTLYYQQEYGGHFGLAQSVDMGSECVASQSAQLVLPGEATYDPDSNWVIQPAYAVSDDTLIALTASFEVPDWAERVDTILSTGTGTEGWLAVHDTLDDLGYPGGRSVYLARQNPNDFLPPGSTHVFDVILTPQPEYIDSLQTYTCNMTVSVVLPVVDTCMSDSANYELQFHKRNESGSIDILHPVYIGEASGFESTMYIPGDFNCDSVVNVSDLTALIAWLFNDGPLPCDYSLLAIDVNDCNGSVNVADLTRFVDFLFGGGAPLECCFTTSRDPSPKTVASVELLAEYANDVTVLTLASDIDLSGIEVHLRGNGSAEPVSLADASLELIHGHADGLLKLGLLDLQGAQMIEAGKTRIVEIAGEYEIVHALGSSLDHRPVGINLASSAGPVVPHSFALHQNYPNPFNPSTTISFDSPETSDYTLTVYNTLGQVVTRFEGTAQSGENAVTWDAASNSSGVYFYKLEIGNNTDTRKMMLLK